MKIALKSETPLCSETKNKGCCLDEHSSSGASWTENHVRHTAAHLAKCGATFSLQLQVKEFDYSFCRYDDEECFRVMTDSTWRWPEEYVTVGRLEIPKQEVTEDWAVSKKLRNALADVLKVQPDGVDKLFAFHPVATHHDNRLIGQIGSFRSAFYSASTRVRWQTIHNGVFKKADGTPLTSVAYMPFDALKAGGFFEELDGGMRADDSSH
eukprot:TRINITY_DN32603_c0_g1_i1.p1 TRINITY_DN32603_c0_g1~~TRINITY_DN32603_c0_g1_i1.p1  ORF type:complete len:210 (+),score=53.43 TRINITY_DN32603_c0_g1_i1:163-792(+)